MTDQPAASVPDTRLKRLFWLRNVSIAGQAVAALAAVWLIGIELPLASLALIVMLLAGVNVFTAWRLSQPRVASDLEILWQLAVDAVLLTAALYLTGGATNPFVSLYLLPLTIAATVLTMRHTVAIALLALAAYT
ncbi:MAG: ATP-binding protein, partial [Burkholderiales bacterium]